MNGEKTYWCLACYNCAKRESMADKHMTTNKYNCKEKHPDLWGGLAKEYPKVKGVKTVTEVVTPATRAIKRVVLDLLDEIHHLRGFIHLHRDEIKFTEDDDELFSYTYDIFDYDESPNLIQEYTAKPAKDLIDLDEDMMRLDCKRDISEFYRDIKTLLSKKEEQQKKEKPKEPEYLQSCCLIEIQATFIAGFQILQMPLHPQACQLAHLDAATGYIGNVLVNDCFVVHTNNSN
jgi:hypothetical protein